MVSKQVQRLLEQWDQDADPSKVVAQIAKAKPVVVAEFIAGLMDNYNADTAKEETEKLVEHLRRVKHE